MEVILTVFTVLLEVLNEDIVVKVPNIVSDPYLMDQQKVVITIYKIIIIITVSCQYKIGHKKINK